MRGLQAAQQHGAVSLLWVRTLEQTSEAESGHASDLIRTRKVQRRRPHVDGSNGHVEFRALPNARPCADERHVERPLPRLFFADLVVVIEHVPMIAEDAHDRVGLRCVAARFRCVQHDAKQPVKVLNFSRIVGSRQLVRRAASLCCGSLLLGRVDRGGPTAAHHAGGHLPGDVEGVVRPWEGHPKKPRLVGRRALQQLHSLRRSPVVLVQLLRVGARILAQLRVGAGHAETRSVRVEGVDRGPIA